MANVGHIVFAAVAICYPGLSGACPAIGEDGFDVTYSGTELYRERSIDVLAGGSEADGCKIISMNGDRVSGYFSDSPDVELHYSGNSGYELRIWADGNCDTKVLVNSGAGNWFYDDDDGPGTDGRLTIINPSNGTYDIWVGTYSTDLCSAKLRLETFED